MIWIMVAPFFFFYGTLLIPIIHGQMMEYRFINVSMNWTQARQSCRENYTDLVTVQTQQDLQRISVPDLTSPGAWIGLFDDPASWYKVMNTDANSWRWSATGDIGTTGYTSWAATEPLFKNALQVCTTLWNNNWHDEDCSRGYRPVCYTVESSVKNFAVSSTLMSWDKALAYCRQNYHDLAMIETQAENEEVFALASTGSVWIGLYREPWRWSDNSKSSFRNWATSEPNNDLEQEHCVAMGSDLLWKDVNCGLQLPFICYGEPVTKNVFRLKLQSTADLSDLTVYSQIIAAINMKLKITTANFKIDWFKTPVKL